jgi:cytochrome c1
VRAVATGTAVLPARPVTRRAVPLRAIPALGTVALRAVAAGTTVLPLTARTARALRTVPTGPAVLPARPVTLRTVPLRAIPALRTVALRTVTGRAASPLAAGGTPASPVGIVT